MKKFSQMTQRVGNRFKQRLTPFFNGVYSTYAKLRKAVGNPIVIDDASDEALQGLRIFGKSTQDGTPTPTAPVEIVSVENPTVNVDEQTLSVPYPIRGIPVTSSGNYTDANGQQWICDEVDFARGVFVRRVGEYRNIGKPMSMYSVIASSSGKKPVWWNEQVNADISNDTKALICNRFNVNTAFTWYADSVCMQKTNSKYGFFYISVSRESIGYADGDDSTALKNKISTWVAETFTESDPLIINYALATPIETPLTADQIEAYKALHTNKPNTTIYNDQNAWMEVEYIKS